MSSVERPNEPKTKFYLPDEALQRARPLPPRGERGLGDDLTDNEWEAFQKALAET